MLRPIPALRGRSPIRPEVKEQGMEVLSGDAPIPMRQPDELCEESPRRFG